MTEIERLKSENKRLKRERDQARNIAAFLHVTILRGIRRAIKHQGDIDLKINSLTELFGVDKEHAVRLIKYAESQGSIKN